MGALLYGIMAGALFGAVVAIVVALLVPFSMGVWGLLQDFVDWVGWQRPRLHLVRLRGRPIALLVTRDSRGMVLFWRFPVLWTRAIREIQADGDGLGVGV